jgi:hypothetical protein
LHTLLDRARTLLSYVRSISLITLRKEALLFSL